MNLNTLLLSVFCAELISFCCGSSDSSSNNSGDVSNSGNETLEYSALSTDDSCCDAVDISIAEARLVAAADEPSLSISVIATPVQTNIKPVIFSHVGVLVNKFGSPGSNTYIFQFRRNNMASCFVEPVKLDFLDSKLSEDLEAFLGLNSVCHTPVVSGTPYHVRFGGIRTFLNGRRISGLAKQLATAVHNGEDLNTSLYRAMIEKPGPLRDENYKALTIDGKLSFAVVYAA